jgi:Ca2+/H+ antiporter
MAHRIITADKNDREKKFDLILIIHCSLLPFYLPTAFLTYKPQCVIPTIVLFFIPTLVSQIYDAIYFFTTAHKNKLIQQQKDAQYEKERLEQERREELGKWK